MGLRCRRYTHRFSKSLAGSHEGKTEVFCHLAHHEPEANTGCRLSVHAWLSFPLGSLCNAPLVVDASTTSLQFRNIPLASELC